MKRFVVYFLLHQNQKMQWINIETFALFTKQFTRQVTPSPSPHTEEGKLQISDVDCLLWAVGHDANIVDLGIDQTRVKLDWRGFIEVDEYRNTSATNIRSGGCGWEETAYSW